MGEGWDYRRSKEELLNFKERIESSKKDKILVSTHLKSCHIEEGLNSFLMAPRIRTRTPKWKQWEDVFFSITMQNHSLLISESSKFPSCWAVSLLQRRMEYADGVNKCKTLPSPDILQFPDIRHELIGKRDKSFGARQLRYQK